MMNNTVKPLQEQVNNLLRELTILQDDKTDMVNSPPHYTAHPSGIECIQVTEHMSFNVGNAVKYLWRCDHKGNPLEDLKKARFYVEREIERREAIERDAELAGRGDETP
jgi:hypothetical protein